MKIVSLVLVIALSVFAGPKPEPQSVKGVSGFENPEKLLRQLAVQKSKRALHHFCVIGYKNAANGETAAWVDWIEGNALILWEPSADQPLTESRRYLNLAKDVVPSEKELQGSTYLVTRAWVESVRADCATAGDKYTISRSSKTTRKAASRK